MRDQSLSPPEYYPESLRDGTISVEQQSEVPQISRQILWSTKDYLCMAMAMAMAMAIQYDSYRNKAVRQYNHRLLLESRAKKNGIISKQKVEIDLANAFAFVHRRGGPPECDGAAR